MHATVYNTETFPTAPRTTPSVTVVHPSTTYSSVFSPRGHSGFGCTLRTTGTLTGTWTLWRANKANPSLADDTDWDEEEAFTSAPEYTNPAGAASGFSTEVTGTQSHLWRFKFVTAVVTGTCTIAADVFSEGH